MGVGGGARRPHRMSLSPPLDTKHRVAHGPPPSYTDRFALLYATSIYNLEVLYYCVAIVLTATDSLSTTAAPELIPSSTERLDEGFGCACVFPGFHACFHRNQWGRKYVIFKHISCDRADLFP